MAKAHVVTGDGTTVNLEGTPQEIATLLKELKIQTQAAATSQKSPKSLTNSRVPPKGKVTVGGLLDELVADEFFKKPKGMGDVKSQLANMGHHYPLTSLSGPLMGYVRTRRLRRFKESGKYLYAQ